jgi:hypothetical protein
MAKKIGDDYHRLGEASTRKHIFPCLLGQVAEGFEHGNKLDLTLEILLLEGPLFLLVFQVCHCFRKVVTAEAKEVNVAVAITLHLLM